MDIALQQRGRRCVTSGLKYKFDNEADARAFTFIDLSGMFRILPGNSQSKVRHKIEQNYANFENYHPSVIYRV